MPTAIGPDKWRKEHEETDSPWPEHGADEQRGVCPTA
jgi:hypothetical protein